MPMGKYNVENQDEYLLKHNLLDADTFYELEQLEAVAFSIRSTQLEEEGYDWLFPISIKCIKQLHYYLFQDIYAFAGEIRSVQLIKDNTRFCQAAFVHQNLEGICEQIKKEPIWISREQAAKRLAYYKTELNMIHPFREGNGRTIRIIIRELAKTHNFYWNFNEIDNSSYKHAMIESVTNNRLFQTIIFETLKEGKS